MYIVYENGEAAGIFTDLDCCFLPFMYCAQLLLAYNFHAPCSFYIM